MHKNKNHHAFTLIEIMIVVAIIGVIVAIALPAYIRARENARGRACQENLAKLEGAKMQYAVETKSKEGDTIAESDLWNPEGTGYLKTRPQCPSNYEPYVIQPLGTDPTCPNYVANSIYASHSVTGTL